MDTEAAGFSISMNLFTVCEGTLMGMNSKEKGVGEMR
jgi:hypothetical protein